MREVEECMGVQPHEEEYMKCQKRLDELIVPSPACSMNRSKIPMLPTVSYSDSDDRPALTVGQNFAPLNTFLVILL